MRTDELTEAMHHTAVVSVPDLKRIAAQGRRMAWRRRVVAGVGAAAAVALVSVPVAVFGGGADQGRAQVTSRQQDFAAGEPLGAVIETDSKFYFDVDPHAGSLGLEAVWAEAGVAPERLTFGFRRAGRTQVLRAGAMSVPDLAEQAVDLPAMPGQHNEPTYVGILRMPAGVATDRYAVGVSETRKSHVIEVRQEGDVLPGYLVFTVSSTTELDGAEYRVTDWRGRTVVRGGFATVTDADD